MPDYILLSGAKKNIGDFLIGERGRELLTHYRPDRTWESWDRFQSIEPRLDEVNAAKAVILLGGPAYATDFYPGIYPLSPKLERIQVPVIPLALGWSGKPDPDPLKFRFSGSSHEALRWIHSRIPRSSCRDRVTQDILHRHGIENVVMTGCTAWHHLPSHGKPLQVSAKIRRVVVTTAAGHRWFRQNVELLATVADRFPTAQRYCVFHRGIGWDRHSTIRDAVFHLRLASKARRLGYEVVDAAYDLNRIAFYHDCDLHLGYRLHAHLMFLSLRKPSFLIHEDGRGVGASAALDTPDVAAWTPDVVGALGRTLDEQVGNGFRAFQHVPAVLDEAHEVMRDFLMQLP